MWLDMRKTNPCVTAFIAMNNHHSQSAGSGDQSNLAQPQDMEADVVGDRNEHLQQHIRTAHGRNTITDGRRSHKVLDAQMDRDETVHEAQPGSDSSGRPCATSSHLLAKSCSVVAMLADPRASPPIAQQDCDMVDRRTSGADNSSDRHSINLPVIHSVSGGPQAARSTLNDSDRNSVDGSL